MCPVGHPHREAPAGQQLQQRHDDAAAAPEHLPCGGDGERAVEPVERAPSASPPTCSPLDVISTPPAPRPSGAAEPRLGPGRAGRGTRGDGPDVRRRGRRAVCGRYPRRSRAALHQRWPERGRQLQSRDEARGDWWLSATIIGILRAAVRLPAVVAHLHLRVRARSSPLVQHTHATAACSVCACATQGSEPLLCALQARRSSSAAALTGICAAL